MRVNRRYCMLLCCVFAALGCLAQREAKVNGTSEIVIEDNSDFTLAEAKRRCLLRAQAEAIKAEFGALVTMDVGETNVETDDEKGSSIYFEREALNVKGDWVKDLKPPVFKAEFVDGKLVIECEVWGVAREIVQSKIDLKWKIMKDGNGKRVETKYFSNGEQIYVNFKSPSSGYVAVYLNDLAENKTYCMLPYKKNETGKHSVKSGKDYIFFDKEADPDARTLNLTTDRKKDRNELILIFSPNPFTKCNVNKTVGKKVDWVNTPYFENWLLTKRHEDKDLVVKRVMLTITNEDL